MDSEDLLRCLWELFVAIDSPSAILAFLERRWAGGSQNGIRGGVICIPPRINVGTSCCIRRVVRTLNGLVHGFLAHHHVRRGIYLAKPKIRPLYLRYSAGPPLHSLYSATMVIPLNINVGPVKNRRF
jgi:hypothetical protein